MDTAQQPSNCSALLVSFAILLFNVVEDDSEAPSETSFEIHKHFGSAHNGGHDKRTGSTNAEEYAPLR